MPKIRSFFEFVKFFFSDVSEEWRDMDHKLVKIAVSAASFIFWAFLWLYFFRSSTPF